MKAELEACRQLLTNSEKTCHQLEKSSEAREADLTSAGLARDEAIKDAKTLALRVQSLEEALQLVVGVRLVSGLDVKF